MYKAKNRCPQRPRGGIAPRGPRTGFQPPTYCQVSRVFDERHQKVSGTFCRHKHTLYRWKGKTNSAATLLSDSLAKWVKNVRYLDTQSIPGVNLQRAIERVRDSTFNVSRYKLIVLLIGTNDAVKSQPEEIADRLTTLINLIKHKNPLAKLACNAILFRPQDVPAQMDIIRRRKQNRQKNKNIPTPPTLPTPTQGLTTQQKYDALPPAEKKRRKINKAMSKVCAKLNVTFLEPWKKFQLENNEVNTDLYADDGLHLNPIGIETLKMFIEGNVGRILYNSKPKK